MAEAKAKCNIARKQSDIDTTEDEEFKIESKLRSKNTKISNQLQNVRKNLSNSLLSQPIKYSDFFSKNKNLFHLSN